MIPKPLGDITAADLDALISEKVMESRTIEYKQELPGTADADKKEFLADVSAFANTVGGDIIYGMKEADGLPEELRGIDPSTLDDGRLRLEQCLRSGLAPRLTGLQFHPVTYSQDKAVLVLRIHRSWAGPHMVSFRGGSRFYTRHSGGKDQMDVDEIRSAFAQSADLPASMRRFRDDRLNRIRQGETPIPLPSVPKIIVHLLPYSALSTRELFAVKDIQSCGTKFPPLGASGFDSRINLDGFLTYAFAPREGSQIDRYCQVYRSGIVEGVSADLVEMESSLPHFPCVYAEKILFRSTQSYLAGLRELGITSPIVLMVSLVGMKDIRIHGILAGQSARIDRENLLLPESVIDNFDESNRMMSGIVRPVFDALWNVAGQVNSPNFDDNGCWVEYR